MGAVRWALTKNIETGDPILVATNTLYTANSIGGVSARDALTGHLLWQAQLEITSIYAQQVRLILLDNELFVGTEIFFSAPNPSHESYFLQAFTISTRKESWYADITGVQLPHLTGIDLGV